MSEYYAEPQLSILVLDFLKPEMTRACLTSIRRHILFPHKVIYLHNGFDPEEHAYRFYQDGLVDQFIQTKYNQGLGIGTRDLVASCFSTYFMMLQNDQVIFRDFSESEFRSVCMLIGEPDLADNKDITIASVSLAGPVGGRGVYSERCHIMETDRYKEMERENGLSAGGAGPFSHQRWREGDIQEYYRACKLTHYTGLNPLVRDCGIWTIRDNPDGSRPHMRTDTKGVWWEIIPQEKYVFPEMTDIEWDTSIAGAWVGGTIPESYVKHSFNCWGPLVPPKFS